MAPHAWQRLSRIVVTCSVCQGLCQLARHVDALSHVVWEARNNLSVFGWRASNKVGASFHSLRHRLQTDTMDKFGPSDNGSRSGTPGNGRFASQAATTEDLLKAQTVGLVNLDDYRKRRAEAIELKERGSPVVSSGAETPLEGYGLRCTHRMRILICQVQGIDTEASVQEEAQDSCQRQIVLRNRRRRTDRTVYVENAHTM